MWFRRMFDGVVHSTGYYYGGQAGDEYGSRDDIAVGLEMVECYAREFGKSIFFTIMYMTN